MRLFSINYANKFIPQSVYIITHHETQRKPQKHPQKPRTQTKHINPVATIESPTNGRYFDNSKN